ncbi:hypothetical protein HPP92_027812 [Vanilla planifolia]|uniref:Cellulose synthase-like protein B3 n=1 Tax=Vanilla planifolia TaxID=51239 RepID=A0A835PB51_VANPL|nr:hypothetical protein HPP92_027812 [Vanilla planifolia]
MRSRASATVFMNGRLPLMASSRERVTEKQTWRRVANLVILFLLLSSLLPPLLLPIRRSTIWFLALFSELCFTFLWFLYLNVSWTPAFYATHPDSLSTELGKDELPAVDVFVTTADSMLEPPLITVNTVLSLLAVEYPADRLACYVSDDGGSPVTCFALVEAAKFAEMWVPFCKRYNVQVRAPFMYFSSEPESSELIFQREWKEMKMKYAEMKERIENAMQNNLSHLLKEDFIEFLNIERGNHAKAL